MTMVGAVSRALESLDPAGNVAIISANVFVQTALMILPTLLLSRTAARRSAAARHAVLLGALACCVIAAGATAARPQGRLSLVRRPSASSHNAPDELNALPSRSHAPARAAAAGVAPVADVSAATPPGPGRLRSLQPAPRLAANLATLRRATSPLRVAGGAILAVWVAGVLLLLARLASGWRWMRAVQRGARPPFTPIPPGVLDAVRRALGGAELPPICESARVAGPLTVGLLRPAVLLPAGLPAAIPPGQLRDVLVHECAHIVRRDQWVGLAQRLVAIALWPQPLIHLLNRELGRAREEVCDNHVLAGQPGRGKARGYARALLALAESMRDNDRTADRHCRNGKQRPLTHTPLIAIGILGPGWPLEARVAGLLDTRRTVMTRLTLKTRLLAVTCCCAVALVAAGTRPLAAAADDDDDAGRKAAAPAADPLARPAQRGDEASARDNVKDVKPRAETRPTTNAAEALASQLDRVLPEVAFDGVALSDVLDFFRDVSGANLIADWKGLESAGVDRKTPISYKAKNVRFRAALREILVLAGDAKHPVAYAARGNVLLISNRARAGWIEQNWEGRAGRDADERTRAMLLRALPEVRFNGVAFADVIDFLRDVSGATINVHWKELEAAGVDRNTPVTLRLRNVPFGQALQLVLLTAAAGDKPPEYTATEGRILIRAAGAAAATEPSSAFVPKAGKAPDGGGKPPTPGGH